MGGRSLVRVLFWMGESLFMAEDDYVLRIIHKVAFAKVSRCLINPLVPRHPERFDAGLCFGEAGL